MQCQQAVAIARKAKRRPSNEFREAQALQRLIHGNITREATSCAVVLRWHGVKGELFRDCPNISDQRISSFWRPRHGSPPPQNHTTRSPLTHPLPLAPVYVFCSSASSGPGQECSSLVGSARSGGGQCRCRPGLGRGPGGRRWCVAFACLSFSVCAASSSGSGVGCARIVDG